MPLPKRQQGESKTRFMDRCLGNKASKQEFTDIKQRIAVCLSQWKQKENKDGKP